MPPDPVRTNGMTSAAASLAMLERRQQVLANNLANVNTQGFKREHTFARMIGDAVSATETRVDLTPAGLTETGNPLDLALEGDGFLLIGTPEGERHIRGGSFHIDADRQVVDSGGNPLLTDRGPLLVPAQGRGPIQVDAKGEVTQDGRAIGRLRMERIDAGANPAHEGGIRFVPDASRQPIPLAERRIKQGHIEESNVNPMDAMTDMLNVLHRFGAAQKTISTLDSVRGIAVNDLGKPIG